MSAHRITTVLTSALLTAALATGPGLPHARADSDLMSSLKAAKIVELNFVWDQKSPLLSINPPFAAALVNTHKQTNGWIPELSFAEDMMYFSGQHGAPTIDAIGHIGHNGKLFGGLVAEQNEAPNGLLALGIEH